MVNWLEANARELCGQVTDNPEMTCCILWTKKINKSVNKSINQWGSVKDDNG